MKPKGKAVHGERMGMMIYSGLLTAALAVSSPWWLWRMATSGRYRAGLLGRLGKIPTALAQAVEGKDVIWLHAVSVGELLAAEKLIRDLKTALPNYVIVVSTTTSTGQKIASERLQGIPVFYMPLDFAFTMLRYLDVLKPKLVVLMESELWPRMLKECDRAGVPVVVVNARISDRSFPRYLRLKRLWQPLLEKVTLFLTQGDESAERLAKIGVSINKIRVIGNLKFDVIDKEQENAMVLALRQYLPTSTEFVVFGSTAEGEEVDIVEAWARLLSTGHHGVMMIAPRHPQRFEPVARLVGKRVVRMSQWMKAPRPIQFGEVLLLDSIGNLAAVYQVATVAFLGGSLVKKGGHNPLEPAKYGVPVLMGPSYENFRETVDAMKAENAISIIEPSELTNSVHHAMSRGRAMGLRGKAFYDSQRGASDRTLTALLDLLKGARK